MWHGMQDYKLTAHWITNAPTEKSSIKRINLVGCCFFLLFKKKKLTKYLNKTPWFCDTSALQYYICNQEMWYGMQNYQLTSPE